MHGPNKGHTTYVNYLPISFGYTSLALGRSYLCCRTREVISKHMIKSTDTDSQQNTTKYEPCASFRWCTSYYFGVHSYWQYQCNNRRRVWAIMTYTMIRREQPFDVIHRGRQFRLYFYDALYQYSKQRSNVYSDAWAQQRPYDVCELFTNIIRVYFICTGAILPLLQNQGSNLKAYD